jgi:hypothetical protein
VIATLKIGGALTIARTGAPTVIQVKVIALANRYNDSDACVATNGIRRAIHCLPVLSDRSWFIGCWCVFPSYPARHSELMWATLDGTALLATPAVTNVTTHSV